MDCKGDRSGMSSACGGEKEGSGRIRRHCFRRLGVCGQYQGHRLVTSDVEKSLAQNFNEPKLEEVNVFYCPGGLNYENMSVRTRLMMRMFVKAIKAKKDKSAIEEEMARVMSASYDISDKKYIEPIIKCLRG